MPMRMFRAIACAIQKQLANPMSTIAARPAKPASFCHHVMPGCSTPQAGHTLAEGATLYPHVLQGTSRDMVSCLARVVALQCVRSGSQALIASFAMPR